MLDLDPRDYDSRDEERHANTPSRGGRGGSGDNDRDHDWRQPDALTRDRDDGDERSLGRGPGNDRQGSDAEGRDRDHDPRWNDRDRDTRDRDPEVRDVFTRHVHLPRGPDRELVHDRDREYTLRGSESRTLATVGAFRVVSSCDLRDHDGPADPRSGDLRHLREQGLIETTRVPGYRDHAVSLTKDGRSLLESHRDHDHERSQTFYAGLGRERELEHDLQVYRAYEHAEDRLLDRGAHIERVVLDHELKSEYQRWLHERDKDRDDYDGHPDRTPDEIREWAHEHDLPYFDDEVHFPDVRVEYQEPDGRWEREDIEVVTPHYRGAHGASVARSGFSCYRGVSLRIYASSGGGRGGCRHPRGLLEELWR
jgi:DNA-binding PadR family transcriptional regulator